MEVWVDDKMMWHLFLQQLVPCTLAAATKGHGLEGSQLISVCSRQAITWDPAKRTRAKVADFVSDAQGVFRNTGIANRVFVAHSGLSLYDPGLAAAVYDLREYDTHPGESYMFRWAGSSDSVHVAEQLAVSCRCGAALCA